MDEEVKTCETCRHFHRHYVRIGGNRYMPMDHGHCGSPWCRDKKVDTPACHRHVKRPGTDQ